MTSQTRMRMSKEAARLIHEYRDNNEHGNNTDAVFGMVADLDVGECIEIHLQKEISALNAELSDANKKVEDTRNNLRLVTSFNVDLQRENLRKREQLADQTVLYVKRSSKQSERYEEKLKTRNEWLLLFVISNVVGWGLAITALAGVMG